MPTTASFQALAPIAAGPFNFGLLVDPPERYTELDVNERIIIGSTDSTIDILGKPVTKIKGKGRFDGFAAFKVFEGLVGSDGTLIYPEEVAGIHVLFVRLQRVLVTKSDIHLANVEFWIMRP